MWAHLKVQNAKYQNESNFSAYTLINTLNLEKSVIKQYSTECHKYFWSYKQCFHKEFCKYFHWSIAFFFQFDDSQLLYMYLGYFSGVVFAQYPYVI